MFTELQDGARTFTRNHLSSHVDACVPLIIMGGEYEARTPHWTLQLAQTGSRPWRCDGNEQRERVIKYKRNKIEEINKNMVHSQDP